MDGSPFHKLTAAKDAEGIEGYVAAFEYAFSKDNPDITNIAVSGPYGSGKSSIVETMKNRPPLNDMRFLTISLTPFPDGSGRKCAGPSGQSLFREVEGQILDQLVHQVDSRFVPKSRFKETSRTSPIYKACMVVALALFAIALAVGLDRTILTDGSMGDPIVMRTVAWLVVLAIALTGAWRMLGRRGLGHFVRKLSFQGNEVEIFDREGDSVFNKHMDDILYILENSRYDVVVFEDLDRFSSRSVFEKLREINQLVNRRRAGQRKALLLLLFQRFVSRCRKGQKKASPPPLRFLYLVSDDTFDATERTKFFDFIIPVRPYVDSLTAAGKLSSLLSGAGAGLSGSIVDDVALYIDDARLLYNVSNEFLVYRKLAGAPDDSAEGTDSDVPAGLWEKSDNEKLFALVAYKNVFPHDFCLLQQRRGYLHGLLGQREELVGKVAVEIDAVPDMVLDMAGGMTTHTSRELVEVNSMTLAELYRELSARGADPYALDAVVGPEEDDRGLTKQHVASMRSNPRFGLVGILLTNGYIDESYEHYMAVFHPGALSESDEFFLKHVAAVGSSLPDRKLDDPQGVLKRLAAFRFGQPATLNPQLAGALFRSDKPDEDDKKRHFALQLAQGAEAHAGFLVRFALSDDYEKSLLALLASVWPAMPDAVFSSGAVERDELRRFAQILLADGCLAAECQDGYSAFIRFVNDDAAILQVDDEPRAKAMCSGIGALDRLEIRAEALGDGASAILKRVVYENGRYAADVDAVCVMLRDECGCADARSGNLFALAYARQDEPIFRFAEVYMPIIMRHCLEAPGFALEGGEEPILWVLNSGFEWGEMIDGIAAAIPEGELSDITAVEDKELWKALFKSECVSNSFANVAAYLDHCGGAFDEALVSFVNEQGCLVSSGEPLPSCYASPGDFAKAVINAAGLNAERAADLLADYGAVFDNFAYAGVADDLVSALIERGVIAVTPSNLVHLRTGYPDLVLGFLERGIGTIVKDLAARSIALAIGEVEKLLEERNLDADDEVALIKATGLKFALSDRYSDAANIAILEACYDTAKIDELSESRVVASEAVQAAIDEYLLGRAIAGQPLPQELPLESCKEIMSSSDLTLERKRRILAEHLAEYSRDVVVELLSLIGDKELAERIASDKGHGLITLEAGVRSLIDALQSCGYCGSDVPNGNSTDLYSMGRSE